MISLVRLAAFLSFGLMRFLVRQLTPDGYVCGSTAGGDADYFADEDEEGGRMFGGGLNEDQKHILDLYAL